jgi:hypothetical protein
MPRAEATLERRLLADSGILTDAKEFHATAEV